VRGVRFVCVESARPAPGVLEAIATADRIIVCPSNPLISIGPILAVSGVREHLRTHKQKVFAVCPIVGGKSLKGPSDKMLAQLGHDPSAAGVAGLYADFTGTLDDVRPALAAMDVFVLPSREEGMSNALMEAMAAARPIVATDVGGNGEVLDRGRLGLLVPSEDAIALADGVGELLDDPARATRLGATARDFVAARWGARAMVAELETFYDRRLAAHGRRAA
jgi:glycosyltransferase involved in cell wall biosynthesis